MGVNEIDETDQRNRALYLDAMRARHGSVEILPLCLPDATLTRGNIVLTDVFVVPDLNKLEPLNEIEYERLNDQIEAFSTSPEDTTQSITISGRTSDGSPVREVLFLNGTRSVHGPKSFHRIEKVVVGDRSATEVEHASHAAPSPPDTIVVDTAHEGFIRLRARNSRATIVVIEPSRGTGTRQSADTWLNDCKRLFIIGEAGQGKTALLRHSLLDRVSRWQRQPMNEPFPVFVRLSHRRQMEDGAASLLDYLRKELPQVCGLDPGVVERWANHPVLWLLDGLDETRDLGRREQLWEDVRGLSAQRPDDRWVLTSRPGAFTKVGLGSNWVSTHLCLLSDDQIESVLHRWQAILAQKREMPLDVVAIGQSFRIDHDFQRLCRNPLFLTLAILFFEAHRHLPDDRWEFYKHADECLRDRWIRHRLSTHGATELLPGRYLPTLLANLALSGVQHGVVTFSREDLEKEVRPLLSHWQYGGYGDRSGD